MLSIIVLIILAALTAVATVAAVTSPPHGEDRSFFGMVAGGLFTVLIVTAGLFSFTVVKAAEVGVPITFGKIGKPMESGIHWTKPWTKVESFPIRPFGVPDVKIVARTSQAGQVTAVVGARWHVIPARATDTYLQVRTGDEERISKEVVDKAIGQAVGNVFSAKDNMTATTDRGGVEAALVAELRRLTEPFGLAIDNVFLRSVEPDAKTADALARVAAQQRATEIATEAQKTALAEAKRREIEAGALKATASEVPTLTPEQVALLCAQTWERMAAKAIEAGTSLYTSPCGTTSPVVARG